MNARRLFARAFPAPASLVLLAVVIGQVAPAALGAPVAPVVRSDGATGPRPDALVVVVSPRSSVRALTSSELRRLFMGEIVRDDAGRRVVPVNHLPGSFERTIFDGVLLALSPDEVGRYWIDRKIRGEGTAPRAFASARVIQRLVAAVPVAVGYVRAVDLDGSMIAVRVDGHAWTEPGYPLRLGKEPAR